MKPMIQRYTRLTVLPEGDQIYSDMATHISIEDNASCEYVRLTQYSDNVDNGEININPEEWTMIRNAVDTMVAECRKEDS